MVRRTIVELTDDLHGGPATATVEFGLDGKYYEVDLNDANAARLRQKLEPYLASWPAARLAAGR
jgi:hypothetical protein